MPFARIKIWYVVVGGVLAALLAAGLLALTRGREDAWICESGVWVRHGNPSDPMPTEGCMAEEPSIPTVASFDDCVAAGYPVMESYPRQCRAGDDTFVEEVGNEMEKIDLIRIHQPRPQETVTSPLLIQGEARGYWFFEASFPVELRAADGTVLASGIAQADEPWMTTDFVPFHLMLEFNTEETPQSARLVLKKDNPSGLPEYEDHLEIPLTLDQTMYGGGPMNVKVFFSNSQKDPHAEDCGKVWPVERRIASVELAGPDGDSLKARRALEELINGPTNREQQEGYYTSINFGAGIKNFMIMNGLATVDFDARLEEGMGGSCRVTAVRAQITETLLQFPEVHNVVISVDSRIDDVLQP